MPAYISAVLVSTLLYEKKLSQNQAAVLLLVDFFITGAYDQFAVLIPAKSMPEELARIGEYAQSITLSLPINELFGGILATIAGQGYGRAEHIETWKLQ